MTQLIGPKAPNAVMRGVFDWPVPVLSIKQFFFATIGMKDVTIRSGLAPNRLDCEHKLPVFIVMNKEGTATYGAVCTTAILFRFNLLDQRNQRTHTNQLVVLAEQAEDRSIHVRRYGDKESAVLIDSNCRLENAQDVVIASHYSISDIDFLGQALRAA